MDDLGEREGRKSAFEEQQKAVVGDEGVASGGEILSTQSSGLSTYDLLVGNVATDPSDSIFAAHQELGLHGIMVLHCEYVERDERAQLIPSAVLIGGVYWHHKSVVLENRLSTSHLLQANKPQARIEASNMRTIVIFKC